MSDIKQLQRAREEAEAALRRAQNAKDEEHLALLASAREAIDRDMAAKHGPAIDALAAAYRAAIEAHDAALDAAARTGAGAPFPIGTRFVRWEPVRWHDRYISHETGVLEAVTKDSEHPDNIAAYRMAKLGSFVIRYLKKDGTPSKRYERWGGWSEEINQKPPCGWYLEGVDPNKGTP